MIIINESGLNEAERNSVMMPLASNQGDGTDLSDLGECLVSVFDSFSKEIGDAVDNIDLAQIPAV